MEGKARKWKEKKQALDFLVGKNSPALISSFFFCRQSSVLWTSAAERERETKIYIRPRKDPWRYQRRLSLSENTAAYVQTSGSSQEGTDTFSTARTFSNVRSPFICGAIFYTTACNSYSYIFPFMQAVNLQTVSEEEMTKMRSCKNNFPETNNDGYSTTCEIKRDMTR